ncbi:MarR family winged helix-turn-helix transcriptional regulator [Streptomyces sp. Tue6028]|uniref:MarR family winged helix-turn-helix transcriptional regulator n=1 Tax=Streptomyces sp. Tue6028 TaxID=2036037 RepID=UPI000BB2DA27|nr:MarR family transcriptional regulator [Streptomyces sp. Tue6028]
MSSVPDKATPGFLVWRLSMKWRVAVDRAVAPLGLTHAQYSLVASLYGMQRDGLRPSQRRLADHTGLEPLYVSKLARALEAAGFVDRVRDPADPRAVQLSLTEDGRAVARRAIRAVQGLLDQLLEPLGGLDGERTRAFSAELATLLDVSLDPRAPGSPAARESSAPGESGAGGEPGTPGVPGTGGESSA